MICPMYRNILRCKVYMKVEEEIYEGRRAFKTELLPGLEMKGFEYLRVGLSEKVVELTVCLSQDEKRQDNARISAL